MTVRRTTMNDKNFWLGLLATTVITSTASILVLYVGEIPHHVPIFYASLAFFLQLSIVVYLLSRAALRSPQKNYFTAIVMGNMLFKLVAGIALVAAYMHFTEIDTTLFIIPFFIVYLGFTIFETIHLYHMSQNLS